MQLFVECWLLKLLGSSCTYLNPLLGADEVNEKLWQLVTAIHDEGDDHWDSYLMTVITVVLPFKVLKSCLLCNFTVQHIISEAGNLHPLLLMVLVTINSVSKLCQLLTAGLWMWFNKVNQWSAKCKIHVLYSSWNCTCSVYQPCITKTCCEINLSCCSRCDNFDKELQWVDWSGESGANAPETHQLEFKESWWWLIGHIWNCFVQCRFPAQFCWHLSPCCWWCLTGTEWSISSQFYCKCL